MSELKFSYICAKQELLKLGSFTDLTGNSIASHAFMQFVYVKSCSSSTGKNNFFAFCMLSNEGLERMCFSGT